MGPGVHRWQHSDVPEAISRNARARLPELSVNDPPESETAVPGRHRAPNGSDKRHYAVTQVREILGQLAAEAAMVDAFVNAMEAKGVQVGLYYVPDGHMLYSAQVLTQQMYPTILNSLRALAGGGMIMLPSSVADFANPE